MKWTFPRCAVASGSTGWWTDWNQVLQASAVRAIVRSSGRTASARVKVTTAQAARISTDGADIEQAGPLEQHPAQGADQLRERQGLDEGLDGGGKPLGREEDAGEEPHRQHDQVHQPADRLGGAGAAGDQQTDSGEGERAQHVDRDHEGQAAADRHVEHERSQQRRTARSGITNVSRAPSRASRKSRRGIGVATNRLSSLAIRKLTSRKPMPQSPPPMAFSPIKPGIRKSM